MDLSGVPTPTFDWDSSNLPDQWRRFRSHVELIFNGPLKAKTEEIKVNYLLLWIGDKGRDIRQTWTDLDTEDNADARKQLKTYYDRFQAHVQPKLNPIFARYKLNNEKQGCSTIEQFVTKLRTMVKDCAYTNADEMIRDRIVFGTSSDKVREKLINEGENLTLDKAIQIAQTYEYSQQQLKTMAAAQAPEINAVHKKGRHGPSRNHTQNTTYGTKGLDLRKESKQSSASVKRTKNKQSTECGRCGTLHRDSDTCPAKGKQCSICKKLNHFAKMCFTKRTQKKLYEIDCECDSYNNNDTCNVNVDSSESDEFYIDAINGRNQTKSDQAFCTISIHTSSCKQPVKFKLDTGSQVNILPKAVFEMLGYNAHSLESCSEKLSAYNGYPLETMGCISLKCEHKGKVYKLQFHVMETKSTPILGMKPCLDLNLIKLVYTCHVDSQVRTHPNSTAQVAHTPLDEKTILSQYKDVFTGIGLFEGECTIQTDKSIPPVIHPPRKVPISLKDKLKAELDSMEKQLIITKVTEPTDWVSSLVVVQKPETGKLRICLDPKDLNKAILRPHYPTKTLEEVLPDLKNAKYFTKLDAKSGYWNIKLDEESSLLTTFNTPFGRYKYLRLPFGLKSSQDEFQRKMDESFEGLNGLVTLVDDILIYGTTIEEHDCRLHAALQRSREKGVKLNKNKVEVGVTQIKYFGHLLTDKGLKPDPDKIDAVRSMKPPTNKAELETFLGMVTYLSKFAPNLSEVTKPLRTLLTKDTLFHWDQPQATAFDQVKDILTDSPVLVYFDSSKPVTIQVDASKFGLGATLMQDGHPVAYASKSLTPTEVSYAQIEKEMYAITFGCKKFHHYVYGRNFKVETDHKPLIPISKKPLHAAPARLQRMLIQLQKYDIDLVYVPGKQIPVADTLSRNFMPDTYPELGRNIEAHVHTVLSDIPMSDKKLKRIQDETQNDPQFQILARTILNGWPEFRRKCPLSIREYWNHRDEMTLVDGIILKGQKLVIPLTLRSELLQIVHTGHMGIEKCLKRARSLFFWPKLSHDLNKLISECPTCLTYSYSNPKEPLKTHEIPDRPWQIVATDLFEWDKKDYIIVVDYYSNFFEVAQLQATTSRSIIRKLKPIFARFGIPEQVYSDNGPQYASHEFTDFARQYDFIHITSSPRYPQSNGLAEKYVQIAKRIFKKCKLDNRDPLLGILEYRTTPLDIGYSPAELLQGRQLRSILPTMPQQLNPQHISHSKIKAKLEERKQTQKQYYDKASKPLSPLRDGQNVYIQQEDKSWNPGKVIMQSGPRSYIIKSRGNTYRRNRRHLLDKSSKCTVDRPEDSDPNIQVTIAPTIPSKEKPLVTTPEPNSESTPIAITDRPSHSSGGNTPQPYYTKSGRLCKPNIKPSM